LHRIKLKRTSKNRIRIQRQGHRHALRAFSTARSNVSYMLPSGLKIGYSRPIPSFSGPGLPSRTTTNFPPLVRLDQRVPWVLKRIVLPIIVPTPDLARHLDDAPSFPTACSVSEVIPLLSKRTEPTPISSYSRSNLPSVTTSQSCLFLLRTPHAGRHC